METIINIQAIALAVLPMLIATLWYTPERKKGLLDVLAWFFWIDVLTLLITTLARIWG